jgi:hypothetical protein
MSLLAAAAVIGLIIAIGVFYALSRKLPQPWALTTACKLDADCPHPKTCDAATGACVDLALPGLILAAQKAAQALQAALQGVLTEFSAILPKYVAPLLATAQAMGLSLPGTSGLASDLAGGAANITKYIQQTLAAPNCDPAKSSKCGYYLEIMALTPAAASTSILALALTAPNVAVGIASATQSFASVVADLKGITGQISANAGGQGGAAYSKSGELRSQLSLQLAVAAAEIAKVDGYAATLTSLAEGVRATGGALFSHFISY